MSEVSPAVSPSRTGRERKRKRRSRTWSADDDALLKQYVLDEFINPETGEIQMPGVWSRISMKLNDNSTGSIVRDHKSCRTRYLDHLRPGRREDSMTDKETYTMLLAVESVNVGESRDMFGPPPRGTWPLLALCFPGRSHLDLKNAFHSFRRHRLYMDQGVVYRNRMLLRLSETLEDPWGTDLQILDNIQKRMKEQKLAIASKAKEKEKASQLHRLQLRVLKDQERQLALEQERKRQASTPTKLAVESIIAQYGNENKPTEDIEVDLEELLCTETVNNLLKYAKVLGIKVKGRRKSKLVAALYEGSNSDEKKVSVLMKCMNKTRARMHTFAMVDHAGAGSGPSSAGRKPNLPKVASGTSV